MFDLAIHGKMFAGGLRRASVYVRGGKIAKVTNDDTLKAEKRTVLNQNQLLLPAATDLHVHLRDWNQSNKETVESGTKSALSGGVTTVEEMPNTDPKLDTAENVRRRFKLLKEKSYVDFAVHCAVPENAAELEGLQRAGAFAVKFFPQDMPRFSEVARTAAKLGMRVTVHAEEKSMIGTSREPLAELECVERLLPSLGGNLEARFAHVSTSEAAEMLARKRRAGFKITMEVTPHHLYMTRPLSETRIGRASAVRPPLRSARNARRMRSLLRRKTFDYYATDHAPHSKQEKFSRDPASGFTALEFAFPLLLTKEGTEVACRLYCENPARHLGIPKGLLAKGCAADMVIFSMRRQVIDSSRFVSKGKVTPFDGDSLDYVVETVFKEGRVAFRGHSFRRQEVKAVFPR